MLPEGSIKRASAGLLYPIVGFCFLGSYEADLSLEKEAGRMSLCWRTETDLYRQMCQAAGQKTSNTLPS